jgi:hypothetical protein
MDHDDPVNAKWEDVLHTHPPRDRGTTRLDRIRVPGGWLYRQIVWCDGIAVALAFVPKAWPPE